MTSYFTQSKSQVLYNGYVGSVPPPILATSAPSTILLCSLCSSCTDFSLFLEHATHLPTFAPLL